MKHFLKETLGWFLFPFVWALDPEFREYLRRVNEPPP
jgi:hypothetical protein